MLEENKIQLFNENCLVMLSKIKDNSIDLILTDPPYGSTDCDWDKIENVELYFNEFLRVIKDKGVILITTDMKLASIILRFGLKYFKYDWVWEKNKGSNFAVSGYQPLRVHEFILVFSKAAASFVKNDNCILFNPQFIKGIPYKRDHRNEKSQENVSGSVMRKGSKLIDITINNGDYKPVSVIRFNKELDTIHPTQKPVDLFRYMIKTYTNEGDLVLDCFVGSGTTAIACIEEKRKFIGCELNSKYYDLAKKRIDINLSQLKLF